MRKSGSVLMVTLWIVAFLVLFSLGLANRAAVSLKLSRYQRDSLKADCLASAGIARAREVLQDDRDKTVDHLNEQWSTGKNGEDDIYKGIQNSLQDGTLKVTIQDEAARIDINKAGIEQLKVLLADLVDVPGDAANIIIAWRGSDTPFIDGDEKKNDEDAYFKNAPLSVPEELVIALNYIFKDKEDPRLEALKAYAKIKDLITVFPADNKVNINTAGKAVLDIMIKAQNPVLVDLAEKIIGYRDGQPGQFFSNNITIADTLLTYHPGLTGQEKNALGSGVFLVNSAFFRIEAAAEVRGTKRAPVAVYDRDNKKLVYWRQN